MADPSITDPFQIGAPQTPAEQFVGQPGPTMGDAWQNMAQTITDHLQKQQAQSAQMGLWDDQTGMPTQAGWQNAMQQIAGNFEGGIKAQGAAPPPFTLERYLPPLYSSHASGGHDLDQKVGPGMYVLRGPNGEQSGELSVDWDPGAKNLHIDSIRGDDLGTRGMMHLRGELRNLYPDAQTYSGMRITGSAAGKGGVDIVRPVAGMKYAAAGTLGGAAATGVAQNAEAASPVMANSPDFSDLGTEAPPPVAGAQPVAGAPDFSDLGTHPMAGPSGSLMTDIPRRLGTAGIDAASSIISLPRTVAQGVDYLGNKMGMDVGADAALARQQTYNGEQSFPDQQTERENIFQKTGATEYVPSTTLGRYTQAGLAAAAPAILNPSAIIPAFVGGGAGEAAAEMVPEHPVAARLAGFLFGAHAASGVMNGISKATGAAVGAAPSELYQAYQRQGIPTTLSGDVTQNPALQRLQSMAAKMPGGEEAVREAGDEAVSAWKAAAEKSSAALGPAATLADAGTGLQSAAQNWLQNFKQNSADKWNAFRQAVPSDTPIKVAGFEKALQSVNQDFGGADALAKALQPSLGTKLKEALTADISSNGTLPWQSVQAVRTRLGEMLESGQPIGDTAQSAIKRLYGGLSEDMRDGATAAGPTAAKAFNQANGYTSFGHTLLDDHLSPILNATEPAKAAQYALAQAKIGGARLAAIEHAMPGQPANLGAAVLREAADNGPGGLPKALKNISPEAHPLLFSEPQSTPPATIGPNGIQISPPPTGINPGIQNVNDLNDIALAMRRTVQSTGNNSNTAAHSASGIGRIMSAIEMGKVGHEIAGLPGRVAGAGVGLLAPNAVGGTARMIAANPLMSRIYSTGTTPFSAPGAFSPNALLQSMTPDQRNLPGARVSMNPLLFSPAATGNSPTRQRQ